MTRQCVCVLIYWLFCMHTETALADTLSPQEWTHKHSFTQCKRSVVARAMAPQVIGAVISSASDGQLSTTVTMAQDNAQQYRDISESKEKQRAWIYSAILPGWGQVYNKQYWKVPVLYAGFVGLGLGAMYYHGEYVTFKQRLTQSKRGDSLKGYVDECRQGRDLCIIFAALWYVINIFDAYAGASLKTFTLSDDITMQVQPNVFSAMHKASNVGVSLTLSLRG